MFSTRCVGKVRPARRIWVSPGFYGEAGPGNERKGTLVVWRGRGLEIGLDKAWRRIWGRSWERTGGSKNVGRAGRIYRGVAGGAGRQTIFPAKRICCRAVVNAFTEIGPCFFSPKLILVYFCQKQCRTPQNQSRTTPTAFV